MSMWGGVAIFAATAWERMPRWTHIVGVSGVLVIGLIAGFVAWRLPELLPTADGQWGTTAERSTAWRALTDIPVSTWLGFRSMFVVLGLALTLFSAYAFWFIWRERPRLALIALAAAMVPIGFSMMDGVARIAPYFSLADAADYINARIAPNDKIRLRRPDARREQSPFLCRAKVLPGESGSCFRAGRRLRPSTGYFPRRANRYPSLERGRSLLPSDRAKTTTALAGPPPGERHASGGADHLRNNHPAEQSPLALSPLSRRCYKRNIRISQSWMFRTRTQPTREMHFAFVGAKSRSRRRLVRCHASNDGHART